MCYNMCYTVNLHVKTNDGYINIFLNVTMKTLKYHILHLWEYFQISDNLDMFVKHLVYNIKRGLFRNY